VGHWLNSNMRYVGQCRNFYTSEHGVYSDQIQGVDFVPTILGDKSLVLYFCETIGTP
jgi:hypothetical protein